MNLKEAISNRKTCPIISHPKAGKTTLTANVSYSVVLFSLPTLCGDTKKNRICR